ncbi:MAG: hypothetical protein WC144_05985 [Sulfurimonas sp.]
MVKEKLIWKKEGVVIEVFDTFFTAITHFSNYEDMFYTEQIDFEEVSEYDLDKIKPNAKFKVQHYRVTFTNGSKIICTEIIFHNKIKEDQKDRLRK